MFKTIPAFAHGGSFHKFLVNTAHISESHYRAAKKDGSFVYPVAIATYMRWCRTVERTSVGSVIEFVLKASDKWEHAPHLASMPLLESMLPSYLTNLWDAIASRPVLINDVDSFWKSYQDQWQRIIQSFSSIAFTYRVRPLALAIIKGLFSNSPSRKNCLDVVPKETGIQEIVETRRRLQGLAVITSGVAAFNELGPDHSVGDDIIDKDHPGYDQRVLDLEILPMMFGIVLKEGKRGVWRLQNLVLERTGILVTDELARIPIAHLTSGHKKSNKLKDGVEKIKRIDDIAKHVGDGDGLTEISRKRNPRLRLLMLDLIKDCKGRDDPIPHLLIQGKYVPSRTIKSPSPRPQAS